jgi:DNA-binding response OmpR family regulator
VRLVRELLVADADPGLATAGARDRARRYLEVIAGGLGLRAGALVVREAGTERLECAASSLPAAANALLTDLTGQTSPLVRRACDERRAFLARRATDDPLVRAVREADPAVDTLAVLPLTDRAPSGVLVLAGDETSLAAEVVRTLNPALRLLALLLAPHRDGGAGDPAAAQEADALRMEVAAQRRTIQTLESHVSDLEAALTAARAAATEAAQVIQEIEPTQVVASAPDVAPARAAGDADGGSIATIVVVDAEHAWERYALDGYRVVVVAPSPDAAAEVDAAHPTRVVVNVGAPGGFAQAVALRAHGVRAPIFGVVGNSGQERIVGLGVVEAVARPIAAEALVGAVERAAPRGARVFAAGRDAEALMKMRQTLAKQGLSVSMARDTKQIDELLAMVRPQVVVIDLELPMRQGYELIMRMAATAPIPALVLLAPDGDPSPILHALLRERLAAGIGVGAKQWLTAMVAEKLASKVTRASAPAPAAQ